MKKPDWWPKNPYPEDIFPMKLEEYPKIVSDPQVRTALSGCLGRMFWDIASGTILDAMEKHLKETPNDKPDLAESQRALGEINKKVCKAIYYLMKDSPKYPDGRSKEISYFEHGMDRLMDAKKIARNARKGGSDG